MIQPDIDLWGEKQAFPRQQTLRKRMAVFRAELY